MKAPRLSRKTQRQFAKLLRPLLKVPREEPLCQYPRPRSPEVVIDLTALLSKGRR